MNIPTRIITRFQKNIPKYKRILQKAKDKDVNESDTVAIISDILSDIFGYEKYEEITSEYAIRGTYCDLAVLMNNVPKFLIEVKAIGINLKDSHLNQALTYGAKEGINYVVLTNGLDWRIYKIIAKPNLEASLLCRFDFLNLNLKQKDNLENLFILTKEAQPKNAIDEYNEKINTVNRYVISQIILSEDIVNSIRLKLKRISNNLKIDNEEIFQIIENEIIKREIIDNDAYKRARNLLKRLNRKKKTKK